MLRIFVSFLLVPVVTSSSTNCQGLLHEECCSSKLHHECVSKHCMGWISNHCPWRRPTLFNDEREVRRSPSQEALCGTREHNYKPCTSKLIADKLFKSCCDMYVPEECHFMCNYEATQSRARQILRYLSSILYCASQNRDNRKCCADLDLNATQLQVGSRCLRMCDPSGSALERMTKEDVTCLYNWNVIMYCHHAGIREM
ncbi:DB module [Trichostrongylus colubriformis]|uniref:DB module n=1 Tax=Trichostrongylus colubriformis TaxID=6319 RepID=A0AAN8EUN6_TRICO